MRLVATVLLVAAALSACGTGEPPRPADRCEPPPALPDPLEPPRELALAELGDVVKAERAGAVYAGEAVSERSIVEIYPEAARSIGSAGYEITAGGNEGTVAEISFRRGKRETGRYSMRQGPCRGLVTIKLVVGRGLVAP